MHQGLVGDRALVGTPYLADPIRRGEYEAEIAPRTRLALARIFALAEAGFARWSESAGGHGAAGAGRGRLAPRQGWNPARVPISMRALDLGAGTGAAGDAVRACFGGHVEIVAVDKVGGPGIVVADLAREERPPGVKGRFDLIVAAHLLNELAASLAARAEMVVGWCRDFLEEGGLCVLLEPALRETSRDLLAVRDLVLERGLRVVAPCFWTGACPALVRERDWCHDSVASPGQPRVDFSYLVLERAAAPPPEDRSLFRVVSDPLKDKGRLRLFGCGAAGRLPLVRLKRDRSDANGAFDAAVRGDVITVTGAVPTNDGLRITSDTTTCLPRSRRGT